MLPRGCLMKTVLAKLRVYWPLTKSLQTGLLLCTGLAGYMTARCPVLHAPTLIALTVSLFLAIAGSTVLNMWYDRDIDAIMSRTCRRPLPSAQVSPGEALRLGLALTVAGVGLALFLSARYALVVFAGWFFDAVVYTVWLKRRTCWSIVWGGISGGMPILAGRVLALGHVDLIGILLSLAILFWIPTHILTFAMRYVDEYRAAGVPTFPSVYGFRATRLVIAISSVLVALTTGAAAVLIGVQWGFLRLLAVLSTGLFMLALISVFHPNERINFGLFKFASVYMLSAMLVLSL